MCKLEILNHWIVPQQGENHSEIDEEPKITDNTAKALSAFISGRKLSFAGEEDVMLTDVLGVKIDCKYLCCSQIDI